MVSYHSTRGNARLSLESDGGDGRQECLLRGPTYRHRGDDSSDNHGHEGGRHILIVAHGSWERSE